MTCQSGREGGHGTLLESWGMAILVLAIFTHPQNEYTTTV
ncbi:predicted protein [Sclerotinia sclerotiorum 1980 UF-70]|uniref:Uncharacterized protein n=1 Tax=Sclerotinia sclerotiorum (strain ATCC 18683 / 1980 / Ss-1) TaxID=665079 RepID=A7EDW3_SCLS1|nr:predicted protein [Sclerotinia sclerotiorum 1980 UF-70]EDO01029.1 predicted protein [Sclerotinia sclerotiorum 1980 UF-70]